jgi:CheY-like chemotaxis protein
MAQILVVENDYSNRDALCHLLYLEGYEVLAVDGGAAALALLAKAPPLVVLLDFLMPAPDGFTVLQHLSADPALRDRHAVILMTTSPQLLSAEACALLAEMRVSIVTKPFEIDALTAAVRAAQARLSASQDASVA